MLACADSMARLIRLADHLTWKLLRFRRHVYLTKNVKRHLKFSIPIKEYKEFKVCSLWDFVFKLEIWYSLECDFKLKNLQIIPKVLALVLAFCACLPRLNFECPLLGKAHFQSAPMHVHLVTLHSYTWQSLSSTGGVTKFSAKEIFRKILKVSHFS